MLIRECWANNRGVRIHYLDNHPDVSLKHTPIVFIPGTLGSAEDYRAEVAALAPRRCIALSLRGRGQSDAPKTGYSFLDHVTDIEAVTAKSGLDDFCLMAYSLGVAFMIGYASRHPQRLAGLIVGDYPARYPLISSEWVERTLTESQARVKPHAVHALRHESSEVLLWNDLSRITCPVLILSGGQPDALLTPETCAKYQRYLSNAEVVVFDDSGHRLWMPDYERFIKTIQAFLVKLDEAPFDPAMPADPA
jgi:pimeloyl-ACP methyl ester carboxylesterase